MSSSVDPGASDPQKLVDSYFREDASYWQRIYQGAGVLDLVHQLRLQVVLQLVDSLPRPQTPRALDVGCGAGLASVALAKRGYLLYALDSVPEMIDMTRRAAVSEGVPERISYARGDVQHLAFARETFDLVLAVGVLPWIPAPEIALTEMCRVLKPGGHLIITTDNRWGLCWFLDPLTNPLLKPIKEMALTTMRRMRSSRPRARVRMISIGECHRLLRCEGLAVLKDSTLGFGPFSFFRREILPPNFGLRLHRRLQSLADRGYPLVRAAGVQQVVLAQKSTSAADCPGRADFRRKAPSKIVGQQRLRVGSRLD
jgi:2-polyprenyl-3-methyl-5-hydroxy-6-metoxy-1,4-benzoquinol methylase